MDEIEGLNENLQRLRSRRLRPSRAERIRSRCDRGKNFQSYSQQFPSKLFGTNQCSPGRRVLLVKSDVKTPQTLRGDNVSLEIEQGKSSCRISHVDLKNEDRENQSTENLRTIGEEAKVTKLRHPKPSGTPTSSKNHEDKGKKSPQQCVRPFLVETVEFPRSPREEPRNNDREKEKGKSHCQFFGQQPKTGLRLFTIDPNHFPGDPEVYISPPIREFKVCPTIFPSGRKKLTLRQFTVATSSYPSREQQVPCKLKTLRQFAIATSSLPSRQQQIQCKTKTLRQFTIAISSYPPRQQQIQCKTKILRTFIVETSSHPTKTPPESVRIKSLRKFKVPTSSYPFKPNRRQKKLRHFIVATSSYPSRAAQESCNTKILRPFTILTSSYPSKRPQVVAK